MGGQACVLYGGAEFSRDADVAVLADAPNLERLRSAMQALQATVIAVPPFDALSLPDLVMAKKTQRDKDWPMIRRLLEANYWDTSAERAADRAWWAPLRAELELLRRERRP